MRQYKKLVIPDEDKDGRPPFEKIRQYFCNISACHNLIECKDCLFDETNFDTFKEWYMNKNKGGMIWSKK